MIDGHVPQPRPDDLRPIHTHWLLLTVAVLLAAVVQLAFVGKLYGGEIRGSRLTEYAFSLLFSIPFILLASIPLGGPVKLWESWRDRNLYGFYWVLWLKGPNHMDSHFVNYKNLPNVVRPGWSLYIPLGGWLNKPFLSYGGAARDINRSVNFRVKEVKWDWDWTVEWVTVSDFAGGLWTIRDYRLLRDLQTTFPNGEGKSRLRYGLDHIALAVDLRESQLASDLADRTVALEHQKSLVQNLDDLRVDFIDVISATLERLSKTRRIQYATAPMNSKEAAPLREWLESEYKLLQEKGDAVGDIGLELVLDEPEDPFRKTT